MRSFRGASNAVVLRHLRAEIKTSTWRQMAAATGASLHRLRSLADRHGLSKPPQFDTPEQRFWANVVTGNGCWGWRGKTDENGYGRFRHPRGTAAHRYSWFLRFGEIPLGLLVCHRCDNPPCCNPEHLFLGTHLENRRDAVHKGRVAYGERHSRTKLLDSDIRAIRVLISGSSDRGRVSQRQVAKEFGVAPETIRKALRDARRAPENVVAS